MNSPASRPVGDTRLLESVGFRTAIAIGCVVTAVLARLALTPIVGPNRLPFITFFPAVTVAAYYGRLVPGIVALTLSTAAAEWLFFTPTTEELVDLGRVTPAVAFIFSCGFILAAIESMHVARARLVDEIDRRRQAETGLTTTLASIGDGVIVTDAQGRVTFLNAEAERLTGWTNGEWRGRALGDVFRIVNEQTRRTAENPVEQVLRLGTTVGLANHTVLLMRNGGERPIDDSAAPIRLPDGSLIGVVLVFRDVTQQRAAQRVQARLAAIVEYSHDAVIAKNLDGIVQSWNTGAQQLFGYEPAEIVGRSITLIVPEDRLDEEAAIVERLRLGQPFERLETKRRTKDGRLIDVSILVSPVRDEEGAVVGASTIMHDIGDIVAARTKVEHAGRMKDEFLATLSHELRTPLNAILGYATLINEGAAHPDEVKEFVAIIERNAHMQAKLVEDLLDMNRIVSGKIQLDLKPVNVTDVINAALNTVRPSAEAKQVRLLFAAEPCPTPVLVDAGRLQQVVWNLLSNAVKFTPAGGSVRVEILEKGTEVEFVVSDTGQGIAPDFLPYVFDRFRQGDATATRRHGGLGLGLSIVRHLVELHGGTVRAESAGKGSGAAFFVTLPVVSQRGRAARDGQLPQGVRSETRVADLRGVRVLAVDDEPDAVALAARILEQCDAEVVTAVSAREAFARLQAESFDVLISDIGMSEEDGCALLRRLRTSDAPNGGVRAIALTAFAGRDDGDRILAAGFDEHLAKPIDAARLTAAVARLAGRPA